MKQLYKYLTILFIITSGFAFSQHYEEQQTIYKKYEQKTDELIRKRDFEIRNLSPNNYSQNKKSIQNKYSTLIQNTNQQKDKEISALKQRYEEKSKREYAQQQENYKRQQIEAEKTEAENQKKALYNRVKSYIDKGDRDLELKNFSEALDNFETAKNILDGEKLLGVNIEERIEIATRQLNIVKRQKEEEELAAKTKLRNEYLQVAEQQNTNKNYTAALEYYIAAQNIENTDDVRLKISRTEILEKQQKEEIEKKETRKKKIGTILGVGAAVGAAILNNGR